MTAGGVMNSSAAALLKLPASATRRKVSSWGLYIRPPPYSCFFIGYHIRERFANSAVERSCFGAKSAQAFFPAEYASLSAPVSRTSPFW